MQEEFKTVAFGNANFKLEGRHSLNHVFPYNQIKENLDIFISHKPLFHMQTLTQPQKTFLEEWIKDLFTIDANAIMFHNYDNNNDNKWTNGITHQGTFTKERNKVDLCIAFNPKHFQSLVNSLNICTGTPLIGRFLGPIKKPS